MYDMKRFANYLIRKRKEKGLTQDQLSELVGVSHQAVSKWERGEAIPEVSKINDLSKALAAPAEEVVSNLYAIETTGETAPDNESADVQYFNLPDKTSVGDVYYLAPGLTQETLKTAINNIIQSRGIRAASMLFRFAQGDYLKELAVKLMQSGDNSLAMFADERSIQQSVVNLIVNADLCPERWTLLQNYLKAGEILIYSADFDFINDTFKHTVEATGNWNVWKPIINRFPDEIIVKQGTEYMIRQGVSSFNGWWGVIGQRNGARMILGYADHFDNSSLAWRDIAMLAGNVDKSILESGIKERLQKVDKNNFMPMIKLLSPETRALLGVLDIKIDEQTEQRSQNNAGRTKSNGSISFALDQIEELREMIEDLEGRIDELESRLDDIE